MIEGWSSVPESATNKVALAVAGSHRERLGSSSTCTYDLVRVQFVQHLMPISLRCDEQGRPHDQTRV